MSELNILIQNLINNDKEILIDEILDILWLSKEILTKSDFKKNTNKPTKRKKTIPNNLNGETESLQNPNSKDEETISDKREIDKKIDEEQKIKNDKKIKELESKTQISLLKSEPTKNDIPFFSPSPKAIQKPLQIIRQMKVLRKVVSDPINEIVDIEKTINFLAETKILFPITKRGFDKWLDLNIIVDEHQTMRLWRKDIQEVIQLLHTLNAFRTISIYCFKDNINELSLGWGKTQNSSRIINSKSIHKNKNRQLTLLVSNCISDVWQTENEVNSFLEDAASYGNVSLLNLLPLRLWNRTNLQDYQEVVLINDSNNIKNHFYKYNYLFKTDPQRSKKIPLPVFSLTLDEISRWVNLFEKREEKFIRGYLFSKHTLPDLEEKTEGKNINNTVPNAVILIKRYKDNSSIQAWKLALYSSSVTHFTLPILRIIQRSMIKDSDQSHLSEFLFGGLVDYDNEEKEIDIEESIFVFKEGVREKLNENLIKVDYKNVIKTISKYILDNITKLEKFSGTLSNSYEIDQFLNNESLRMFAQFNLRELYQTGLLSDDVIRRLTLKRENIIIPEINKNGENLIEKGNFVMGDQHTHIYNGEDVSAYLKTYYTLIAENCQKLPLGVVDPTYADPNKQHDVKLTDIYTDLYVVSPQREDQEEQHRYPMRLARGDERGRTPILEAISSPESPMVTLLGNPGSGKTTFLNYLTYRLLSQPDRLPEVLNQKIIIRIVLREAAQYLQTGNQADPLQALWKTIHKDIEKKLGPETANKLVGYFQKSITQQPCLVLLDGLDDVSDAHQKRKQICEAIKHLSACLLEGSRVILTARPYAYAKAEWQIPGFQILAISDFDLEQITKFIEKWYETIHVFYEWDETESKTRTRTLISAVREKTYLSDLASRPVILTLMVALHSSRGKLSEDRVDLYEESVALFQERWQRRLPVDETTEQDDLMQKVLRIDQSRLRTALNTLAFHVHSEQQKSNREDKNGEGALITRAQLLTVLDSVLKDTVSPHAVIDYIEKRSGLLVALGDDLYAFPHRSFQEYLAASYLLDQKESALKLCVLVREDLDWWREVFLMGVGRKKRGGVENAIGLINTLFDGIYLPMKKVSGQDWQLAILAAEAVLEIRLIENPVYVKAYSKFLRKKKEWLVGLIENGDLNPLTRLRAGDVLGKLGDERRGVNVIIYEGVAVPDVDWIEIPAGVFLMGSTDQDKEAYAFEKPQHEVFVDQYWISRYPLTNAQYAPFVFQKGYDNPEWWTKNGLDWLEGKDSDLEKIEDEDLRENYKSWLKRRNTNARQIPYYWQDSPWNQVNRPVVGVSWYETKAYCAWLTALYAELRLPGLPTGKLRVALPSEAQWEKAVRGLTGNIYSNGNQFSQTLGNGDWSRLNQTSTVGLFPKGISTFGLLDGCGNVLEWTHTRWGSDPYNVELTYPYQNEDGQEDENSLDFRVLRGGSWLSDQRGGRCACRDGLIPGSFFNYLGFRPILSLIPSES